MGKLVTCDMEGRGGILPLYREVGGAGEKPDSGTGLELMSGGGPDCLVHLAGYTDMESEAQRGQDMHPGSCNELRTESEPGSSRLAVLLPPHLPSQGSVMGMVRAVGAGVGLGRAVAWVQRTHLLFLPHCGSGTQ